MARIPTQESDVQKVIRIAKELDISLEEAVVTCAGFEMAFSDESTRRQIFAMIDELDDAAYKKGEPLGLIVNYAVELEAGGIRVGRYADEVPPGEVVSLTPTNRAVIFLRIKDNFPTQQFLGPMIVNRPRGFEFQIPDSRFESEMESEFQIPNPKSQIQNPKSKIGYRVVRSDKSQIQNPKSQIDYGVVRSDKSQVHIPKSQIEWPLTALPAGMPACHSTSGLSPPLPSENWDTPNERCSSGPRHLEVETYVSHIDL